MDDMTAVLRLAGSQLIPEMPHQEWAHSLNELT